jgi:hypothetical protein
VAGTPSSYAFDRPTGRFNLAYSTKGPTGKNFARRTKRSKSRAKKAKFRQTQIFLGRDRYPGGYTVHVNGGGIASKAKSALLRVIACPGRRNVTVAVSPGSGRNHTDCRVTRRHRKHRR